MANFKNYNTNKLDFKLSQNEYWDFFLAKDDLSGIGDSTVPSGCLAVHFDFNDADTYPIGQSIETIASLVTWSGATNTGYTFNTIGLTGIDNGFIKFEKISADTSNNALLSALTGSTLVISSGDTRLYLNAVSGSTNQYVYPLEIASSDAIGNHIKLCGGFYQGYYKLDGSTYEVLPNRVNKAWVSEFWLNKSDVSCSGVTGTTLNDLYPDNKGFFFYMGTRAENKFWNQFNGIDSGCTSGCTVSSGCSDTISEWCTIPKESDITLSGDYGVGIPLNPPLVEINLITNPFLIYGRAHSGSSSSCNTCNNNEFGLGTHTVCTYDGNGIVVTKYGETVTNTTNPFLIYGRAHSGSSSNCNSCGGNHDGYGINTICSFSGFTKPTTVLDYKLDIIDNALGFRIKDDGSIGYRLLTVTASCINDVYLSGYTIQEEYSASGMVSDDQWTNITIKFISNEYLSDCELTNHPVRKGRLMFYVNGYLKFVVRDFNEFIAKRLNDYKDKQVGVPFNFSIGGGTQGLLESQTFDGRDPNDMELPIENNFAGSFIGYISDFKFYICDVPFIDISDNYINGMDVGLLIQDDGFLILTDDDSGIII